MIEMKRPPDVSCKNISLSRGFSATAASDPSEAPGFKRTCNIPKPNIYSQKRITDSLEIYVLNKNTSTRMRVFGRARLG